MDKELFGERDKAKLRALLKLHEGLSLIPYRDGQGWSVGYGWHMRDAGLVQALNAGGVLTVSREAAEALLEFGIEEALDIVRAWLDGFVPAGARGAALVSVAYTLGPSHLRSFQLLRSSVIAEDWASAAVEAVDSRWADQVGKRRAGDISDMLATNLWPILGRD